VNQVEASLLDIAMTNLAPEGVSKTKPELRFRNRQFLAAAKLGVNGVLDTKINQDHFQGLKLGQIVDPFQIQRVPECPLTIRDTERRRFQKA